MKGSQSEHILIIIRVTNTGTKANPINDSTDDKTLIVPIWKTLIRKLYRVVGTKMIYDNVPLCSRATFYQGLPHYKDFYHRGMCLAVFYPPYLYHPLETIPK